MIGRHQIKQDKFCLLFHLGGESSQSMKVPSKEVWVTLWLPHTLLPSGSTHSRAVVPLFHMGHQL